MGFMGTISNNHLDLGDKTLRLEKMKVGRLVNGDDARPEELQIIIIYYSLYRGDIMLVSGQK